VFRHCDHKFEWTVDECVAWCRAAAADWGYEVIIDGIGRSATKDPWGRDGSKIRATQAVTFRRREGTEWAKRRASRYAEWASSGVDKGQPHKLLAQHHYEAHAAAEKPAPREVIVAAIKEAIETIGTADVTTFQLWREEAVSSVCGGWLEVLIDVVGQDESFVVHREGKDAEEWVVEWPGANLQSRSPWQDPWAENSEEDDAESYEDEEYSEEYEDDDEDGDEDEDEDEDDEEEDQDEAGDGSEVTVVTDWTSATAEGWGAGDSDVLKDWAEWKPAPGWIEESGWN